MKNVVIIDYLLGNLFSVKHACEKVGIQARVSSDPEEVRKADAAILPGVGAFGDAMKNLYELDLIPAIQAFAKEGKPIMGICLGMQLLFEESEEFGSSQGLSLLKGTIKRFPKSLKEKQLKVPQIGWNQVFPADQSRWKNSPLKTTAEGEYMYFVHSYYCCPQDDHVSLSITQYGDLTYTSGVMQDNIFAVQYHPEKSAAKGLEIYENWSQSL